MAPDDASRVMRAALARLGAAAARQRAATAARLGLQPVDLLALSHVERTGETRPGELAEMLLFTRSGMTRVARRLANAGLLTRSPGPANHQNVLLRPSADGRRVLADMGSALDEGLQELATTLSPTELHLVERVLSDLAARVESDAERLVRQTEAAQLEAAGVRRPVRWG
jgi:DNA-binding MarR family transcriptional regulator